MTYTFVNLTGHNITIQRPPPALMDTDGYNFFSEKGPYVCGIEHNNCATVMGIMQRMFVTHPPQRVPGNIYVVNEDVARMLPGREDVIYPMMHLSDFDLGADKVKEFLYVGINGLIIPEGFWDKEPLFDLKAEMMVMVRRFTDDNLSEFYHLDNLPIGSVWQVEKSSGNLAMLNPVGEKNSLRKRYFVPANTLEVINNQRG